MSKKLKFSLELNENGDLKIDIEGNGMEIGEKLFLPFFFNSKNNAIPYAVGVSSALKIAYPHVKFQKQHSIE